MPGRGPLPKRSDQRRRTNAPDVPYKHAPGAAEVPVPPPIETWHPIAKGWYESLAGSGQVIYYEPSDWALAVYVAQLMSETLTGARKGAENVSAVLSQMGDLLVTEGSRRRARIELERQQPAGDPDEQAAVVAIDDWAARLTS